MVDTVDELLQGMRDMRVRQALLVTALLRLGEPLKLTPADATAASAHDIDFKYSDDGLVVSLKKARR